MPTRESAIDIMKSEHRRIEAVLGALEVYVHDLTQGAVAERGDLSRFVRFFRDYADTKHHAKEEDILFAAMLEAGFPRNAGPIPVMLHEHEMGRSLVAALAECTKEAAWTKEVQRRIRTSAMEFSLLLRGHIQKEDRVLYEMARSRISPEVMQGVDAGCAERDEESKAQTAELLAIAEDLCARYAVACEPG